MSRETRRDARGRLGRGTTVELQLVDVEAVHHAGAELLGDDRLEVGFGDLDLLVGQLLEPHEGAVERVALHVDAHLLERVGERVPARVLAHHDLRGFLAHG